MLPLPALTASGINAEVHHLPPHPKVEGSSLTTAANAGREKRQKKLVDAIVIKILLTALQATSLSSRNA
jgi:hypothetical protein